MKITTKDQLKHGMRVKCEIKGVKIDNARISIDSDEHWIYICQNIISNADDADDMLGYKYAIPIKYYGHYELELKARGVTNLRTAPKTLDDLEYGDVVVRIDNCGSKHKKKVLGRLNDIVFLSSPSNFDESAGFGWNLVSELKEKGYKLEDQEEEPETIEVLGKTYNKAEVEKRLEGLEEVS